MRLLAKRITGIVCPRRVIDQTLTSQGFVRRRQHPPVYDIQIEDVASGTVYRLRIPTDSPIRILVPPTKPCSDWVRLPSAAIRA